MEKKVTGYKACALCARRCGVNRSDGQLGFCSASDTVHVNRRELHMWEEPCISGERGSGTVFFSSCSLGCAFCQNREISRSECGKAYTPDELAEAFISLEKKGAHNINLVTPTHYMPSIKEALQIAKDRGLSLPVVYNTGSIDTPEALRALSPLVDVYLADFKYYKEDTAGKLCFYKGYPKAAKEAVAEMVRQRPQPKFKDGIMTEGVIVRILLLPGHVAEAKLILKYLFETYGDKIYVSLMSQYTPIENMTPPLDRRVTKEEYRQLVDYAERLGVKQGFVQEHSSASKVYIPDFITE